MTEPGFSNLNPYANLEFLEASNAKELHGMLTAYRGQMKILAIYAQGASHIAWVQTGFQKIKKETKNGKRS